MPLHEYECEKCHHRFEAIQKFSDPPFEACPRCGGPVHKLIAAPAFQFKGSGWYVTDYAKKDGGAKPESETKPAAAGSGTEGKSESKTETKSDSKTETKSDTKTETRSAKASPDTPAA